METTITITMEEKKTLKVNTAASKTLYTFKQGFLILGVIVFLVGFIVFLTDVQWLDYVNTWAGLLSGGVFLFLVGLALKIYIPIVSASEVYLAEKGEAYKIEEKEREA